MVLAFPPAPLLTAILVGMALTRHSPVGVIPIAAHAGVRRGSTYLDAARVESICG